MAVEIAPGSLDWWCGCTYESQQDNRNSTGDEDSRSAGTSRGFLALKSDVFWNPGYSITVRFLQNPDVSTMRAEEAEMSVRKIVREWEDAANIRFVFVPSNELALIRVRFIYAKDSWSLLGTKCERERLQQNEPTMELSLLHNEQKFRYQVLHEFGHALGCVHEHPSPKANIEWNEEQVAEHYKSWGAKRIQQQITRRYDPDEVTSSEFDTSSVMMYPIEAHLVKQCDVEIRPRVNSELSKADKAFIRIQYPPFRIKEEVGIFPSWSFHSWKRGDWKNTAEVVFDRPPLRIPTIAVGLSEIDLIGKRDVRVEAVAPERDITTNGFTVHTKTWEDSGLCSAAAMWFRIDDPETSSFRTGTLDTFFEGVPDLTSMPLQKDFTISFGRSYHKSPPEVFVWLRGVHLGGHNSTKARPWNIDLTVHDVTLDGFTLRVEHNEHALLYRAMVTWVAYPKTSVGIYSGVVQSKHMERMKFETLPDNRSGFLKMVDISEEKKKKGCLATDFQVHAGITSFELGASDNFRLETSVRRLDNAPKFWVRMGTWNKSDMKSVSVTWLVVHPTKPG